jgi:hypothetical protein
LIFQGAEGNGLKKKKIWFVDKMTKRITMKNNRRSFLGGNKLILTNPSPYICGEGTNSFDYGIFLPRRKLWIR